MRKDHDIREHFLAGYKGYCDDTVHRLTTLTIFSDLKDNISITPNSNASHPVEFLPY